MSTTQVAIALGGQRLVKQAIRRNIFMFYYNLFCKNVLPIHKLRAGHGGHFRLDAYIHAECPRLNIYSDQILESC